MTAHLVGVFAERAQAECAVEELRHAGFPPDQIGVVVRGGGSTSDRPVVKADVRPEEGAATGAVAGGVLGSLVGAGVALTIPAIGPALAVGVLAGVLGGATLGIATGGLIGGLIGMGISHEEASYYESEFIRGRTLVTVQADDRSAEAAAILTRCGALQRPTVTQKG